MDFINLVSLADQQGPRTHLSKHPKVAMTAHLTSMWVLGFQTQVFMLKQQVLHWLSPGHALLDEDFKEGFRKPQADISVWASLARPGQRGILLPFQSAPEKASLPCVHKNAGYRGGKNTCSQSQLFRPAATDWDFLLRACHVELF